MNKDQEKLFKKTFCFMECALIFVALFLVIFVTTMATMFYITGDMPEALVTGTLDLFKFECGFTAIIEIVGTITKNIFNKEESGENEE